MYIRFSNGENKVKKIIHIIGIISLLIIVAVNLVFTATLDVSEKITINFNSILFTISIMISILIIYFITKILDKQLNKDSRKNIKKEIFWIVSILYSIFCILWVIIVRPGVGGDSIHVYNLAQTMYRGNLQEFLPNATYMGIPLIEYIQSYPQQLTLAFIWNCFFHLINLDNCIEILRIVNALSCIVIAFTLYKITKQISKKHETNKFLFLILMLTFISLPMLSTFIYGDTVGLALCLISTYLMMKYTETKKIRYPILASISMMIAYMMRMNSSIFIIATVIYLTLNLFEKFNKKEWKENALKVAIIVAYIIISIIPSSAVKSYYSNKYELDKNKSYPFISYIIMAMEESRRGNGWYNEGIAEPAIKDPEMAKQEYPNKIKERIKYFSQNLGYTFNFYKDKITSTWAENTYSAIYYNKVSDKQIEKMEKGLIFYQKAIIILMCLCSFIVLIKNRKKLSLDVIFLTTIFIGGFAFHILWETKSRYIIPYILVLIPIASIKFNINIKEYVNKKETKLKM